MRFDRLVTVYLAKPLRKLVPLPDEGCISILRYSRISSSEEAAPGSGSTTPKGFAEQMEFLAAEKFKIVPLHQAVKLLKVNAFTRRHVVLTFDYANQDFLSFAYPVLHKYGFPATVFLAPDWLDRQLEKEESRKFSYLSRKDIKTLGEEGISFGLNTVNPAQIASSSSTDIQEVLTKFRKRFEQELQRPFRSLLLPIRFSLPHNSIQQFRKAASDSGFECCLTSSVGKARAADDVYALKSLPMSNDDLQLFAAKLEGAYNWMDYRQTWFSPALRRAAV